jgi:sulfur dioxygenase
VIFRQLFDPESSTYTYLVADRVSRQAVLIDPVAGALDAYLRLLAELKLTLVHAVDTHVHADHVTALGMLRQKTGCVTVLGAGANVECVSRTVRDGEVLKIGALELRAIATPGHTAESFSFALPDRVFTGDTLLIRGTGRTDFQNGNAKSQYESLFEKLLKLPDETLVYPGHDYKGWTVSTIGEEKAHNPRLQVASAEAYVALMNALHLPTPRLMDVAVPANQACGNRMTA